MDDNRSENNFVFNNDIRDPDDHSSSEKSHLSEYLMKIPKDDLIIMLFYHGKNRSKNIRERKQNNINSNTSPQFEIKFIQILNKLQKEKIVELIIQYCDEEYITKRISDITGLEYNELRNNTSETDDNTDENETDGDNTHDTSEKDDNTDENETDGDNTTDEIEYELDYEFGEKFLIKKASGNKGIGHQINLRLIKNMNIEKVIFIRYHKLSEDKIEDLLEEIGEVHLINVGCSQTLPPHLKSKVEITEIQKPRDLKRLGILSTGAVRDTEEKTLLSFDDIDTLIKYVGIEKLFKFLHMFLSKATDSKTIAKLSINKESTDIKNLNTINPLFDDVIDFK